MKLSNKIAVVTGGAQGIGLATAELLASEGASVVIGDLCFSESDKLVKRQFNGCGSMFEAKLDVADEISVKDFFKKVTEQFGTVDILYNNAGICKNAMPFEDIPRENWDKVLAVNTFGAINCTKTVIPFMKVQESGKIVNSTSVAAEVGGIRTEASYAASKAANICLTMSLAKYLGPYNINVNAVSPGIINTDMTKSLDPADVNTIPLRRIGEPEDVANAILFLVSDMSDYLTGVVLDINGGQYMR
ncbi:SDR family oxidoreductase [Clostridium sp. HV4-5-A1G]|nr:SDR family oxidoreductase [Clostridium sp. HV4-5-A1G]